MGIHSSQLNTMLCTSLLAYKYFWRIFMGLVLMTTTTTSLDFLMGHLLFWDGWKEEKWDLMNNTNNSNNTRRPPQRVEDLDIDGPSDNLQLGKHYWDKKHFKFLCSTPCHNSHSITRPTKRQSFWLQQLMKWNSNIPYTINKWTNFCLIHFPNQVNVNIWHFLFLHGPHTTSTTSKSSKLSLWSW